MASKVLLIDPNLVNTNNDMTNGIPQYQDMYIFAELTAERRGRTLLEMKGTTVSTVQTGLEDNVTVNFIGNNQDKSDSNPNYLNFTTNWYDGSTGNKTQFESFGISSIKVSTNSSFVPQVNVQFVDVRGLTFFNQENSPYRILFDFPPPIFTLTIKGYYGMPLKYQLHLVKYTSEFKSENGNFIIDAQFVAMTFAPLTDVLFRYVVNFPLIDEGINANPNPTGIPKNTYELILKIKNLFTQTEALKNSSTNTQKYDNTIAQLRNNTDIIEKINSYSEDENIKSFNPILSIKNNENIEDKSKTLTPIKNTFEYDRYIKGISTEGIPDKLTQRLLITCLIGQKITNEEVNTLKTTDSRLIKAEVKLNDYKEELINQTISTMGFVIEKNDIPRSGNFVNNPDNSKEVDTTNIYAYIDITNYYMKLYKQRIDLNKVKADEMKIINEGINDLVLKTLGMKPTIYNIFKILLNDVDKFFNILRTTSMKAEEHHNTYISQIINDGNYVDTKGSHIYAFPLVIKQETGCNSAKVRTAPTEISNILSEPFPEIELVQNFIETFYLQQKITEQLNLKSEQNADGTNKWIPIAPVDSTLASTNIASPYFGIDTSNGGSKSQPILPPATSNKLSSDTRLNQILTIILKRFYILTQNTYANIFYYQDKGSTALIDMYSQSEAVNLSSSITNTDYTKLLSTVANRYGTEKKIQEFYDYIEKNIPDLYNFSTENKKYIQISSGGDNLYTDKSNSEYKGFTMHPEPISTQAFDESTNSPISNYQKTVKEEKWYDFFNKAIPQSFYSFTNENVFLVNDNDSDGSNINSNGTNASTRFLASAITFDTVNKDNEIRFFEDYGTGILGFLKDISNFAVDWLGAPESYIPKNKKTFIDSTLEYGNFSFERVDIGSAPFTNELNLFGNIVDIWTSQLSKFDTEIFNIIINNHPSNSQFNRKLSALIILSSFGYALSPFNIYPHKLNEFIFNTAAAVEMPTFLPAYIGALINITPDSQEYSDIYDFFLTGPGKNLSSSGCMIFSDITDVNRFLSAKDKEEFKALYDSFDLNALNPILIGLNNIYNGAQTAANEAEDKERQDKGNPEDIVKARYEAKKTYYQNELNASTGRQFKIILQPLIERTTLINFSTITFKMELKYFVGYESLKKINDSAKDNIKFEDILNKNGDVNLTALYYATIKGANDNYFIKLFETLNSDIQLKESNLNKEKNEFENLTTDPDIMTQGYYSFKNINDKWLTNPYSLETGYPFNQRGGSAPLIDSFAFVDRAMNPIGDTIINPEMLVEMLNDQNISLYTVLTQLLSANGFEFFPIQNFMSYQNNDWENSFKIDTSGDILSKSAFVCMFIGGSSSYPSNIYMDNQFEDDGISDLSSTEAPDFSKSTTNDESECQPVPSDDAQIETNNLKSDENKFPYGQVRAFRVKFGAQNQSMFSNIKIDSKEYPETNESIQILSRIAGDNKGNAPPPKGQNLYNTYENRAYKATVSGLGNAMIQPTQYFQLENIPIFNGAYLILSVEHTIEPNKMTTSFSGTKILKYPVSRVLDSSAIFGFEGGNTDNTNPALSSANEITKGLGVLGNPKKAQFNSMYDLKTQ